MARREKTSWRSWSEIVNEPAAAKEMQRITGDNPQITWVSDLDDPLNLTDEQATSIFRIAQEALNNALKHAEASTIAVKLERASAGELRLRIEDDGVGVPAAGTGDGLLGQQYGLVGMRERARMIAARLEVESLRREVGHELADVLYFVLLMAPTWIWTCRRLCGRSSFCPGSGTPLSRAAAATSSTRSCPRTSHRTRGPHEAHALR